MGNSMAILKALFLVIVALTAFLAMVSALGVEPPSVSAGECAGVKLRACFFTIV